MTSFLRKSVLATALVASSLASATPAMADPYYGRRGGDTTGAAIAGGIVGLAIGAIIASSGRREHDRRYRDGYYDRRDGDVYYRDGRYYEREQNYRGRDEDCDEDERRGYERRGYRGGYYRGY